MSSPYNNPLNYIAATSNTPFFTSEAREEFGNEVASKLKLTKDGRLVLWPQPSDDPEDPQNVSSSFFLLATVLKFPSGATDVKAFSCS